MMRRCGHKKGYENVSVCDEWARNYETFRDWALLNGYREDLTIDRIDYTKGYSPENCRWVDHRTQANNRRSNVFIEYGGKRMTAAQWEVDKGFPRCVISCRLKRGWSVEDAIMTPYKSRVKYSEMRKRETAGRA